MINPPKETVGNHRPGASRSKILECLSVIKAIWDFILQARKPMLWFLSVTLLELILLDQLCRLYPAFRVGGKTRIEEIIRGKAMTDHSTEMRNLDTENLVGFQVQVYRFAFKCIWFHSKLSKYKNRVDGVLWRRQKCEARNHDFLLHSWFLFI